MSSSKVKVQTRGTRGSGLTQDTNPGIFALTAPTNFHVHGQYSVARPNPYFYPQGYDHDPEFSYLTSTHLPLAVLQARLPSREVMNAMPGWQYID